MIYRISPSGRREQCASLALTLFAVSLIFSGVLLPKVPRADAMGLGLTSFAVCKGGSELEVSAAQMAILLSQGAELGPCPESEPEPDSDLPPQPDSDPQLDPDSQPDSDPQPDLQPDPDSEPQPQPQPDFQPEPDPQPEPEPAVPTCKGLEATIYVQDGVIVGGPDDGDEYDGTIDGTSGSDVIVGTAGNDRIRGRGGDDHICGGEGDDALEGGSGNDWVCGEAGADTVKGEGGDDVLCGGDDNDILSGGFGNDELNGGDGTDDLDGDAGSNTCFNGEGVDDCTQLADESFSECFESGSGDGDDGGEDEGDEEDSDEGGSDGGEGGDGGGGESGDDDGSGEGGGPDGDMGSGGGSVGGGGGGGSGNSARVAPQKDAPSMRSFAVAAGGRRGGMSTRSITVALSLALDRELGTDHGGVRRHGNVLREIPVLLARTGVGDRLSAKEQELTCDMQRNLLRKRGSELNPKFLQWTAGLLGNVFGRDAGIYADALGTSGVCEDNHLAVSRSFRTASADLSVTEFTEVLPPNTIPVTEEGLPTSSDPVFNSCIENRGWVKDGNGNRINCRRFYNSKHEWEHPDLAGVRFVFNPSNGRLLLPEGYEPVILTDLGRDALHERRLLRLARRVFDLAAGYPLASRDFWSLRFSLTQAQERE